MPYNNLISRTEVQPLIPESVSQLMLQGLVADSAALDLFTRIPLPTNITRFPVLSALPTAYFVSGDTGLKQSTEVNWADKFINVEEIAAIVPIPESVLADAPFDLWAQVRPLLQQAIARALDQAVFFGTNKPASWPADILTAAVAAGNVAARGGKTPAQGGIAEDLNVLMATLEADGYMPTGFVGNPLFKQYLRGARGTDGQRLLDISGQATDLFGLPVSYPMPGLWPTGLSAGELFALQRENFIIGVRQDFSYKLITEGVITDNLGAIIYNLPQQDMVALRVVFRVGFAVSNNINYQQATEANRYPAAVLRSPAA